MDSIAAITGILRSAGEVTGVLGAYVAAFEGLPMHLRTELKRLTWLTTIVQVHSEARSTKLFLAALGGILQNLDSLPARRAAIIKVDHLVAILTDGIHIFSELQPAISSIRPFGAALPRINSGPAVYMHLECGFQMDTTMPVFEAIFPRLEALRISLSLMVEALQADTDERAASHVRELDQRVSVILQNHPTLSSYLASDDLRDNDATVEPPAPTQHEAGPSRQPHKPFRNLQANFKNLLSRRPDHREAPSGVLSPASAPFASLGLSEISSPYVVMIPVQPTEIRNAEHYGLKSAKSPSSPPIPVSERTKWEFINIPHLQPDRYVYQDCLVIRAQLGQVPRLKRFLEHPWPSPNDESSYSQVLAEMHLLRRLLRSGGLHVITQMIQMAAEIFRTGNETNDGQSHLSSIEDHFDKWKENPEPVYVRSYEGNTRSKTLDLLAREVSFFTMACLDFPDLESVMNVKGSTNWLFTTADILHDGYKGFVKVIGVIKTVLERLTLRGMLKDVNPKALYQAELDGTEHKELEEEGLPQDDPPAYESPDEETKSGLGEKSSLEGK